MTEKAKRRPPGSRAADRVLAEIAAERARRPRSQCGPKLDLINAKLDGIISGDDTLDLLLDDGKDGDHFGPKGLRLPGGEDF